MEKIYIDALLEEWKIYLEIVKKRPLIREIHLGGGTPTFFSPENLYRLISAILDSSDLSSHYEFSFEGHPNNTTSAHLKTLFQLGFQRVSFGIQDINEKVQIAINRIQPFYNVVNVTQWAREIGYKSINYDFVYGLPFQNSQNLARTIQTSLKLRPDRIAFYSYAHVPWTSKGQRAYSEKDLPGEVEKASMYLMGRELFKEQGYTDIGMDHFAMPDDDLARAKKTATLHRNFMGYTTASGDLLIGLGCSAISDAKYAYAQNSKTVEEYLASVKAKQLPLTKGHHLTQDDETARQIILKIATSGKYEWMDISPGQWEALRDLESDGIIRLDDHSLEVTKEGMLFLRNVCSVFDQYLSDTAVTNKFSKAI